MNSNYFVPFQSNNKQTIQIISNTFWLVFLYWWGRDFASPKQELNECYIFVGVTVPVVPPPFVFARGNTEALCDTPLIDFTHPPQTLIRIFQAMYLLFSTKSAFIVYYTGPIMYCCCYISVLRQVEDLVCINRRASASSLCLKPSFSPLLSSASLILGREDAPSQYYFFNTPNWNSAI